MGPWRRPPPLPSTDPRIANYENQTQQVKEMKWVLISAIVAGTLLMMISILFPFIAAIVLPTFLSTQTNQTNQTNVVEIVKSFSNVPRDVLPFATALAGFAGGVITAIFRTTTQPPTTGGQGTGGGGQGTGSG
jgi:hypothetical protein